MTREQFVIELVRFRDEDLAEQVQGLLNSAFPEPPNPRRKIDLNFIHREEGGDIEKMQRRVDYLLEAQEKETRYLVETLRGIAEGRGYAKGEEPSEVMVAREALDRMSKKN